MIALLRSTDGNPDSRFEKYIDFLDSKNIKNLSICWDRKNSKTETNQKIFYKRPSSYGMGLANIKGLIGFNRFIYKNLKARKNEYNVIHACDFDTVIPATLMHIFHHKRVIYDVFDWYIDSRALKGIIKFGVSVIEYFNIKCADAVIICEPERRIQLNTEPKQTWILPNIPNYSTKLAYKPIGDVLTIAYVGVLGIDRGIENLIRYAKENSKINLKIAGFGPLESLLSDVAKFPNITYYGSVKYRDALEIMNGADIVYAMYQKTNRNHILAAPNKYYEGLYLGKPIITTRGTIVGDKTDKFQTGYVIEESYQDLVELIANITPTDIETRRKNARDLWDNKYSTYVNEFLEDTYLPYIKEQA